MQECCSALQVPEFRVAYTVTTDALDALYKKLKPKGVTMTALLAKAAGVALASHPVLFAGPCRSGCPGPSPARTTPRRVLWAAAAETGGPSILPCRP